MAPPTINNLFILDIIMIKTTISIMHPKDHFLSYENFIVKKIVRRFLILFCRFYIF